MFVYSRQDIEKQKIINNINKQYTQKQEYNSEWYTTKEDKFYMLVSIIAFIIILALTL
jgi:hypothetical protein